MIDEHHPLHSIGMFPMDMKCQQAQQQRQQQQHQLQQQANNMLLNGNERMLTAAAATATTTATAAATNNNGHHCMDKMSSAAVAVTTTPSSRNVNGNCNDNRNSNSNNNNNNKTNNNNAGNAIAMNNNQQQQQQQQQPTHACGPGPPAPLTQTMTTTANTPLMTSVSGRVTLAECSLNAAHINNNFALQQALHQQQQQQQQQQHSQHHQPSLQLSAPLAPPPAPAASNALTSLQHPAAMLATTAPTPSTAQQMLSCLSLAAGNHSTTTTTSSSACSSSSVSSLSSLCSSSSTSSSSSSSSSASLPAAHCGYCCQPICDRYIMRVVDTSFHEGCLKCSSCSLHLAHSCFARDGKLYCRIDYERLYIRNRCLCCGHKIASDELVMRTHENVFHLKCFACVVCGILLKKGEQYVVKQGQLFCRFDYEKEVEMLQGYDFYGDDLFPPKMDGRRGPKRPRTILNTQQRRAFKASFEVSPKPCRKVRENLAKETGLSLRIVQVWFQNQRAKVKKIQKKAKQEPQTQKGTSDSQDSQESQDSSLTKIKDETHSDSESQLESPYSTGAADSIAKLRCLKDEHENVPFNCMETNKENCNKTNEPILNTILGLSYATFQQLMGPFTQTPMINPIDRLYSMQNSYFRPDELAYGECNKEAMDH